MTSNNLAKTTAAIACYLVLTGCASSQAARELAAETSTILVQLDKDTTAITQSDKRTERLRAALIGVQLQNLHIEEQKFQFDHAAGLAAEDSKEILIKFALDVVGKDGEKLLMRKAGFYSPEAILAQYPDAPSPIASYKSASKSLKMLTKKTSTSKRLISAVQLVRDISKSVTDAREEAKDKEDDAKQAIEKSLEDKGTKNDE